MNILVSCMGYDSGKSGISAYMRNVLANMKDCGHALTLVVESGSEGDFPGFKHIVVPGAFSKSAKGFLWHMFALPFVARRKKHDCLLVLAANRRFTAFGSVPQIGVVHDLSQYRVDGKYDSLRMFYLKKIQPALGRKYSAVAAISKSTMADVILHWEMDGKKVRLNYNGLNGLPESDDSVLKRLGLGKYIYYVSRIEHPGKNHMGLIKAYESLPREMKDEYKLVFTGPDWNGAEAVREYAANSKESKNIVFTGYVTGGELAALYRNASAFVFPSFSEGFGFGLIEAMSAGVPCACSNDSALDEIGADAALKFDPKSADEIRNCVERILGDPALSQSLVEKGAKRCMDFDWKKHAQTLLKMCESEYAKNSRLDIFDIKFDNARMDEIVSKLRGHMERGEKKTVAFINTHYLNTAYGNIPQTARLNMFDYVLPDGSGVSLACKILGYRYRDNLNGTDLLPRLCELSEKHGYSMYFFGGKEGVAKRAVENLKKDFPKLNVAGMRSGYFTKGEEDGIIAEINRLKPDFLFVGFGAVLQEKWVVENIERLDCKIALAIGGVCDVYSGDLFRVPAIMRKMGLEWLGRLWQDPVRLFGRYAIGNPLFIMRVIKYKFTRRGHRK